MWWEHVKGCRCCNRKGHMYACGLSFACLFAAILQYPMHTFAWICRDEMTEKEPGKKAVLFTTGGKQKSASSGIHQVLRCGKQEGWLNFLDFPILLNFLVRTISAYRCSLTINTTAWTDVQTCGYTCAHDTWLTSDSQHPALGSFRWQSHVTTSSLRDVHASLMWQTQWNQKGTPAHPPHLRRRGHI